MSIATAPDLLDDYTEFTLQDLEGFANENIKHAIRHSLQQYGIILPEQLESKLKKLYCLYMQTKETFSNFTGLIFTGYGEEEFYPSLIPVNISFSMRGRLRYFIDIENAREISNSTSSIIRPFAQVDVINTIITGVDPTLENAYMDNFVLRS